MAFICNPLLAIIINTGIALCEYKIVLSMFIYPYLFIFCIVFVFLSQGTQGIRQGAHWTGCLPIAEQTITHAFTPFSQFRDDRIISLECICFK